MSAADPVNSLYSSSILVTMTDLTLRMTYDLAAYAAYIYLTDRIEPGSVVETAVLDFELSWHA